MDFDAPEFHSGRFVTSSNIPGEHNFNYYKILGIANSALKNGITE